MLLFQFDSDSMEMVMSALESTHAALAVMTHHGMPKQLYNEEVSMAFFLLNMCVLNKCFTIFTLSLYHIYHLII